MLHGAKDKLQVTACSYITTSRLGASPIGRDDLETILILKQQKGAVRSIDIANELEFSKPSISVAMKNLRENGFVEMDSAGYITLTDKGRVIAETMYERHTWFSNWLIGLGVDPQIAVKDACRIEHVISAESFDAIRHSMEKKEI